MVAGWTEFNRDLDSDVLAFPLPAEPGQPNMSRPPEETSAALTHVQVHATRLFFGGS